MDPSEYFQKLKPHIIENRAFMANLRTYAFADRLRLIGNDAITPLGAGRHNIHFRIGKIGDVWLATREYLEAIELADHLQHCENYIAAAVRTFKAGKRVPKVCGAVKAENDRGGRYFLLLEDLTGGGTSDYQAAPQSGGISGMLNGEEVFHDFDTNQPFHPPTKYLSEEKMLVLSK